MPKPRAMTVATSVFIAGIGNALIYTLGFLAILVVRFLTMGGGGATIGSSVSALLITLILSLLLSSLITFLLAFPIAAVCLALGFTGVLAFILAPAVGSAIACAIGALMHLAPYTFVAIVAFAYITSAVMWLTLGRPGKAPATA